MIPAELREEQLVFGREPWRLPATLTVNTGVPTLVGMVLVHGSGPHDRDESVGALKPFRDLAWGLAARGVAVLRFEKRTYHYRSLCTGRSDFTVRHEVIEDALGAIEALRRDPRSGGRIVILGHSFGGMLAPRIAAEAEGAVGIILMAAPARPLPYLILEQMRYQASLSSMITPAVLALVERQVRTAMGQTSLHENALPPLLGLPMSYWRDLRTYDAPSATRALQLPTLILHGENDFQVPVTETDEWRRVLCGSAHVHIKSYADLNHFMVRSRGPGSPAEYSQPGSVSADVMSDIATWIRNRCLHGAAGASCGRAASQPA